MIYQYYGDIFDSPPSYSLGHCISADARMSKGIALQFVKHFPQLQQIRDGRNLVGNTRPVFVSGRFIYNLITKTFYWGKPYISDLYASLMSMRAHAESNRVGDISLPKIGCGCDGLNFGRDVLPILSSVFAHSSVNVHVFTESSSIPPRYVQIMLGGYTY